VVGIQQLRYHEFRELGRAAKRIFNQRQVIANGITMRRAPDALRSCTTLKQFYKIMEQCLKPAGFDGFSLSFSPEFPAEAEMYSVPRLSGSRLRFFWDRSVTMIETSWSLRFNLQKLNGERLGCFTLYRRDASPPAGLDLEMFSATGFTNAVARVVEKMQDAWFFGQYNRRRPSYPAFGTTITRIEGRERRSA
jgi:hypothetical protein